MKVSTQCSVWGNSTFALHLYNLQNKDILVKVYHFMKDHLSTCVCILHQRRHFDVVINLVQTWNINELLSPYLCIRNIFVKSKKSFKIPEAINRRSTMGKRKRTEGQTTIYNILHRLSSCHVLSASTHREGFLNTLRKHGKAFTIQRTWYMYMILPKTFNLTFGK